MLEEILKEEYPTFTASKSEITYLNNDDFVKLMNHLRIKDTTYNTVKYHDVIFKRISGDLSDLGNEIGQNIGKMIDDNKLGFDEDDFTSGIRHGVSLIDGSHG